MKTLVAAACPESGIGAWREANGLPVSLIGETIPRPYFNSPKVEEHYWVLENNATASALRRIVEEMTPLFDALPNEKDRARLTQAIREIYAEASRLGERNSGFGIPPR